MTDSNFNNLTAHQKAELKKALKEKEEFLSIQSKIAAHRASMSQSRLEQLKAEIEYFSITKPEDKSIDPTNETKEPVKDE